MGFVNVTPPAPPKLVPNQTTIALLEQIDNAVSLQVTREVDRRLGHLGIPPVLTPNITYQYGPPQAAIVRHVINIPASSSWNPTNQQHHRSTNCAPMNYCPANYMHHGSMNCAPTNCLQDHNHPARPGGRTPPPPPPYVNEGEEEDEDGNSPDETYTPSAVPECLMKEYHFERDFHVRSIHPFPHAAIAKAPGVNARRQITKRRNSRVKRAMASEDDQKTVKLQATLRRSNRAAKEGRVRFFYLPFLFLAKLLWGMTRICVYIPLTLLISMVVRFPSDPRTRERGERRVRPT